MIVRIVILHGFQSVKTSISFVKSKLDIFGKTRGKRAPGVATILCRKQFTGINRLYFRQTAKTPLKQIVFSKTKQVNSHVFNN